MDASHRGPVVNMSNYDFFVIGMHKLSNKQSYVEKSLQYGDCFFGDLIIISCILLHKMSTTDMVYEPTFFSLL